MTIDEKDLAYTIADTLHGHAYITRGDVGRAAHVIRQALKVFAIQVAAAEREACASIADDAALKSEPDDFSLDALTSVADSIRARSTT